MRALVRSVVDKRLRPLADAIAQGDEVDDGFPAEAFAAMADAELFRIPFDAPYGVGLESRATATAVTVEELAYASNSLAAIFDVHCILAGHAVSLAAPRLYATAGCPRLTAVAGRRVRDDRAGCFHRSVSARGPDRRRT